MKTELNLNELEQANGGWWPIIILLASGIASGVVGNYIYDKVTENK